MPLSSLHVYFVIGYLMKSFPESIIIEESASTNILRYSRFTWLNGSITLIRAETERYVIARFSGVTTKGLCNNYLEGGSKISKVGLKITLHPP